MRAIAQAKERENATRDIAKLDALVSEVATIAFGVTFQGD